MRDWLDNLEKRQARQAELEAMQPIERNAILLADLERQWSVLGPLRPITYTIYIGDSEQDACAFETETKVLGFDTSLTCGQFGGEWSVHATRSMEPTAENVTHWEEWFKARIAAWDYTDCWPSGFRCPTNGRFLHTAVISRCSKGIEFRE